MMPKSLSALTLLLAALAQTTQGGEHRQHDAHEHGAGTLTLVIASGELQLELESPAADIVGFEHPPRNAREHQQIQQAATRLEQGEQLFRLPADAGCHLRQAEVEAGQLADAEAHRGEQQHAHRGEEGHSEYHVVWHFQCTKPSKLAWLETNLFKSFPAIHRLQVLIVTPAGQTSAGLDQHHNRIEFP